MRTAAALFCTAWLAAGARAAVVGRLDFTTAPALGAWQSLTSVDQAVGLSKRVWHLDKDEQELVRLGIFGGVFKPMFSEPAAAPHALGGFTLAVPGSLLDWALGTSWGQAWLPKLKTGLLGAYDLTRPSALHARPSFFGFGLAYPLGAP